MPALLKKPARMTPENVMINSPCRICTLLMGEISFPMRYFKQLKRVLLIYLGHFMLHFFFTNENNLYTLPHLSRICSELHNVYIHLNKANCLYVQYKEKNCKCVVVIYVWWKRRENKSQPSAQVGIQKLAQLTLKHKRSSQVFVLIRESFVNGLSSCRGH